MQLLKICKKTVAVLAAAVLAFAASGCESTVSGNPATVQSVSLPVVSTEPAQSELLSSAVSSAAPQSSTVLAASTSSQAKSSLPAAKPSNSSGTASAAPALQPGGFLKGVWLSCYDLSALGIKGISAAAFRKKAGEVMQTIRSAGYNTVFCHVRAFGDAYYPSAYYPFSADFTGVPGKSPGYDPLAILLQKAKENGLAFHAWINPYRVRLKTAGSPALSAGDPAQKWLNDGSENAVKVNGGIYYNPGSAEVRRLVLNGVEEILRSYKVDGIHFDDYFYPTTDAAFDQKAYAASGKKTSLENWRRNNVNVLVSATWQLCKKYGVTFGISPSGHLPNGVNDKNFTQQYADLCLWLSSKGYVDYLAPQLYWGYSHSVQAVRYAELLKGWFSLKRAAGVQLYIGLAGYKIGTQQPADKADYNSGNLLARQVQEAAAQKAAGIINFSYSDLTKTDSAHKNENKALKSALGQLK